MRKNFVFTVLGLMFSSLLFVSSCKKDNYVNPYDDPALQAPDKNPNPGNLSPGNIAYLHYKVFKPTCANSGCHDGTFAPDFRTINGTYNTLIYQKPVKQILDPTTFPYEFKYRVWPFHGDSSALYQRLIFHKDTFAERMPLYAYAPPFYPYPYWTNNIAEYTLAIKNWINAGAKDMFGNYPTTSGNNQPQITGLLAFSDGSISGAYSRGGGNYPPVLVPAGKVDVWFLVSDDSTALASLSYLKCRVQTDMYDTTGSYPVNIIYEPSAGSRPTGPDFNDNPGNSFTHKVKLDFTGIPSNTHYFLRAFIDDNSQGAPTEIPNAGSNEQMMGYFALKIQ